jgi:cytidylate kinase
MMGVVVEDALIIDASHLTIEAVVEQMLHQVSRFQ